MPFQKHTGFYVTTENPNVMMKENHNTQSCEYLIICQDGLYIVSTTPEEILHIQSNSIITENAQSDTLKPPCCCFECAPYTALTII